MNPSFSCAASSSITRHKCTKFFDKAVFRAFTANLKKQRYFEWNLVNTVLLGHIEGKLRLFDSRLARDSLRVKGTIEKDPKIFLHKTILRASLMPFLYINDLDRI